MALIPNIDTNNLVIFYYVAVEKSLTGVAEKLHLTQPAISYHIKTLEEYTGVKLLEFKKQQVKLTPSGEGIFKYAEEIYRQLVNAERYIQFIKEPVLRVGIANIYSDILNPVITGMLNEKDTKVKLSVRSGNTYELTQHILDAELDIAVVPQIDHDNAHLRRETVSLPERMVCFTSNLRDVPGEPLDLRDLRNYDMIAGPDRRAVGQFVLGELAQGQKEERLLSAEVDDIDWYIKLIENTRGIGFVLLKNIHNQVREGKLRVIKLKKEIYINAESVSRSDVVPNPFMDKFISLVKKEFGYTC